MILRTLNSLNTTWNTLNINFSSRFFKSINVSHRKYVFTTLRGLSWNLSWIGNGKYAENLSKDVTEASSFLKPLRPLKNNVKLMILELNRMRANNFPGFMQNSVAILCPATQEPSRSVSRLRAQHFR